MKKENGNFWINILNRIKWPLSIGVLGLVLAILNLPNKTLGLLIHKINLVCVGLVLGHFFRKELFPYIDLEILLKNDKKIEIPDAIKFAGAYIGTIIFYYTIVNALIAGL